jgi:hypothetical protein
MTKSNESNMKSYGLVQILHLYFMKRKSAAILVVLDVIIMESIAF